MNKKPLEKMLKVIPLKHLNNLSDHVFQTYSKSQMPMNMTKRQLASSPQLFFVLSHFDNELFRLGAKRYLRKMNGRKKAK